MRYSEGMKGWKNGKGNVAREAGGGGRIDYVCQKD